MIQEQETFFKNMLKLQKTVLDNYYNTMCNILKQSEGLAGTMSSKPPWEATKEWNKLCLESNKQFQDMMKAAFQNMGDYFPFKQDETEPAPSQETKPAAGQETKTPKAPPTHTGKTEKQKTS